MSFRDNLVIFIIGFPGN